MFRVARDWSAEDEPVALCGVDEHSPPVADDFVVGKDVEGWSVFTTLAATRWSADCGRGCQWRAGASSSRRSGLRGSSGGCGSEIEKKKK